MSVPSFIEIQPLSKEKSFHMEYVLTDVQNMQTAHGWPKLQASHSLLLAVEANNSVCI